MAVQPAWSLRVATAMAVLLAALGLALAPSSPAAAAPTDLSVSVSPGSTALQVGGGDQTITFTVANGAGPAQNVHVTVDIPLIGEGVQLVQGTDGCRAGGGGSKLQCRLDRMGPNESEQVFIRLRPPGSGGPEPGQQTQGEGRVTVESHDDYNSDNNSAGYTVTLRGPQQAQGVSSVSGTVEDEKTGKPVRAATVMVTDSKDGKRTTKTNDNGRFKVSSTPDKPIAPGSLSVKVSKKGYAAKSLTKSGEAGEAVTIDFSLPKAPKASASASPTADAKDTGAADDKTEAAADEGTDWGMWLVIAFGILLVLGGIGAIVLLFVRRGDESEDDLDEYGEDAPRPAPARADYPDDLYGSDRYTPSHTTPLEDVRPTTVMGATGTATVGMGAAGYPGGDQPTSMMNRIEGDEPTRAHPGPLPDDGYRGAGYGPGSHGAPGVGSPDRYGQGADYGRGEEYGSGRHGSVSGAGYGSGAGHGADGGYGADSGYSPGSVSGAGYGSGGGYGAQPDYGAHQPGGRGGYGDYGSGSVSGAGYGSGSPTGSGRHSAGDNYGGYDERPPRRGSGRHSADGDDRRLDWYDD